MSDSNEQNPVKDLERLRAERVKARREAANNADSASVPAAMTQRVVEIQQQIDVIDRAIADEKRLMPPQTKSTEMRL